MKFSEMPYARPDTEALKALLEKLTADFAAAESFEAAEKVFLTMEEETGHFETQATLASIRHDVDTRDEFYDKERDFFDEVFPELQAYLQKWTMALLQSPFRPQFEEKYGSLPFVNAELELKSFSEEIIGEMQKENALCSEYSKLIASAQIPFDGGVYTLSQLTPFKQSKDDEKRLAAWKAEGQFYVDNGQRLDEIYHELTQLRNEMGKKLGYGGYTQLGYYRMQRNCYTKEDVEQFRLAVQKYLVPVADKIYRRQAERLGVAYPLSFADAALDFRSGNATPKGSADDILAHAKTFYHELSPETAQFIDVMLEGELLDVLSRTGKSGGGYCTSLPDYKVPFIFANFNGTSGDVEVMTHEAGHAFAGWMARDIVPMSCQWPSLEACEVHSMSMEFLSWPWAEGFFGDDTRKFRYAHLAGALTFIPYGTMVDHFQHIVYEKPEMTPAERHAAWKELLGIYMPWLRLDGDIPFYAEGKGWQRQRHIYESPFYYIDYCLAQTVALEIWAGMVKDPKAAWEQYMAYTRPAGTKTFRDLVAGAGLEVPFDEACLKNVCAVASKWLDEYDLTGIV